MSGRKRSWAHITSGATFEALGTAIIALESPGAKLFGRRGKDGGQDARSADGKTVFQAKHHESEAAKDAIADALAEADKIERYRDPSHGRYEQWKKAEHWQLVTNVVFNPTDQQHWDEKVVPRFQKLKLEADYWEQEDLNGFLDKYAWIDRSFFENEIRVFQTVAEARERFADEEPFLPRAAETAFVGRDAELRSMKEFLNGSKSFLLVNGSGGIGKTRLLIEVGEDIESEGEWQVLWANVASLSVSGSWFEAIVPERKTLLLVDEPDDPKLLQVLAEQLGPRVGRLATWKIFVAVRSPKDPVLRYFHGPRRASQVQELRLGDLASTASVDMCRGLLEGKVPAEALDAASKAIAKQFSGHPIWITLAVHLVESFGDWQKLPTTSQELAREYIKEVVEKQDTFPPQDVERVLRWLALAGNINRESLGTMDLLAERAGVDDGAKLGAIVNRLIERRALVERGAHKRIVEVKPDVIRDRILIDWLTAEVGGDSNPRMPTKAARDLANAAIDAFIADKFAFPDRITLTALARAELVLRLDEERVDLLAPFWNRLNEALPKLSAQKRVDLIDVLLQIAPFRPREISECVRFLRMNPVETERVATIFRTRDVGQRDVLLALPWLEFHAALGASEDDCTAVVQELCSLVIAENEVTGGNPPNDGKRAGGLLNRVLEGGPQFVSSFDAAARASALSVLEPMATADPTAGGAVLINALIVPLVSVERMQSWSSANAFHWRRHVISPDEDAFTIRTDVLHRVRSLLESSETPLGSRVLLWKVIVESHRSVNSAHETDGDAELLENLRWARTVLQSASLEELRVARDLWDWHLEFDQRPEIKEQAEALEALYRANDVAREFEQLLHWDEPALMDERHAQKARELSLLDSSAVEGFLARGLLFLGDASEVRRLLGVAFQLGRLGHEKPVTPDFVQAALRDANKKAHVEFALEVLAGWMFDVRKNGGANPVALITTWFGWCVDDSQRVSLLQRLFAWYGQAADKGAEEQRFLRESDELFMRARRGPEYIACVSYTFWFEWDNYTQCMQRALDAMPPEQVTHAIALLIDGVDRGLRLDKEAQPPHQLGRWLLDQMLRLPSLDSIGGNTEWHVNEIIKRVGRVETRWLLDALRIRATMEQNEPFGNYGGVGHSVQLTEYVVALSRADVGNEESVALINALFGYLSDRGSIGYRLPDILHGVDPEGLLVPDAIADRVTRAVGYDQLAQLARLGEGYVAGTAPWRVIAKAVVRASAQVGERERRSLFHALGDPGPRSWSGTPGEVAPAFTSALEVARARRDAETDDALRPYWDWYVSVAQAQFDEEVERAKEERGE
jgi:hypothetical protein